MLTSARLPRVRADRHVAGPDDARRSRGARRYCLRHRRPRSRDRHSRPHGSWRSTRARGVRAAGSLRRRPLRPRGRVPRRSDLAGRRSRQRRHRGNVRELVRGPPSRRSGRNVRAPPHPSQTTSTPSTAPSMLSPRRATRRPLVYVPNCESDTVDVSTRDATSRRATSPVGGLPQHVVPSWDLRTLYVTNDTGNRLTPIDPRTGQPGRADPRRRSRTTCTSRPTAATRSSSPSGSSASTSATRTPSRCTVAPRAVHGRRPRRLLGRRPLPARQLRVLRPAGRVDVAHASVSWARSTLRRRRHAAGRQALARRPLFYVADMTANGVWLIDGRAASGASASCPPARARTACTRAATRGCSTSPTAARARSP